MIVTAMNTASITALSRMPPAARLLNEIIFLHFHFTDRSFRKSKKTHFLFNNPAS